MKKIKIILLAAICLIVVVGGYWTKVALYDLPVDNHHYTVVIINKTKYSFSDAYIEFDLGDKQTEKIPYILTNNANIYINAETKRSTEKMNSLVFIVKIGDEEKCVKPKYFDGWVGGMCRIYIREENGEIILDAQSDTILKNCYLYATDIIFNRIFGKPQLNYMPFPSIE